MLAINLVLSQIGDPILTVGLCSRLTKHTKWYPYGAVLRLESEDRLGSQIDLQVVVGIDDS